MGQKMKKINKTGTILKLKAALYKEYERKFYNLLVEDFFDIDYVPKNKLLGIPITTEKKYILRGDLDFKFIKSGASNYPSTLLAISNDEGRLEVLFCDLEDD